VTPDDFVREYGRALASQDWARVAPLIHDDACVTFSSGQVHRGKEAVRRAFEGNFAAIEGERYEMKDLHWCLRGERVAVCQFEFEWSGLVQGRRTGGAGRGTSVLVSEGGAWRLLVEHLGPAAGPAT
jgi:ketosteroid isomerase-like protein